MKKRTTLIAMAMIMIAQITSATVWRVNNRPNADADFTTIQAAHNGATSGDTLYIEGSPTGYGTLACTKQLHIIGTGDFLNDNTETQAFKEVSNVSTITFNAGSENSIVEGVRVVNTYVLINTSDITVRRNRFHTSTNAATTYYGIRIAANSSNVLIENNWIYIAGYYAYATNYGIHSNGANLSNLTIRNNYIYTHKTNAASYSIYLSATVLSDNVAIYQNVINTNNSASILSAQQTQFYNNIMIAGTFTPDGSYYNNNMGNSTQFGSTNGNQENVAPATIFVDYTTGIDSDLQLIPATSPAIGAGIAGEDCGIYGGSYPYHISLLPAIPAIWEVTLNNYGSDVVPINVNIKAKAHN
ncbi:MAG: hypothetical protein GXO89_05945 [Chlorobi bacterium]|nr:hypothetical protein [Chlorobiota bacterium]